MEVVITLDDAAPQHIEKEMAEDAELLVLDESDVQAIEPGGSSEESSRVATDAARDGVDAVIGHTVPDESAMEVEGVQEEVDDGSTRDTLPMMEGSGEDSPEETVEGTKNGEEEVEDASPSVDDESSQMLPDSQGVEQKLNDNGKLAVTFPHCHICGFDRETMFMKEKKVQSGKFKNKILYRNRCVRKKCNRFFGPSYVYNGKIADFMKISEQSATTARPFENEPREEKYPAEDYEKAAPSGVRYPPDNNYAQMRATKVANKAATSASSAPVVSRTVKKTITTKASTSKLPIAKASTSKMTAVKKSAAPKKKPRKGYFYVDEMPPASKPDRVLEFYRMHEEQKAAEAARAKAAAELAKRTFGTQTGDEEHIVQVLIEELKRKGTFRGLPNSDDNPLPASMSNRLFLVQKTLKSQTQTITTLRKERDFLKENLKKVVEWVGEYRNDLVSDATRLKEDVQVVNRELRNFSLEMQSEANKDIRDLNKLKMQMADRIDDMDRVTKKIEASLEYQKSLTMEAEILADKYHRISVDLEKDVIKAQAKERDISMKLDDKLYLTNNAKCTHCKVNIQIKNMLTEQVADKTLLNTNLSKERETISKELKNLKLVHSIVSKENNQLKFELKAWESNSHKLKLELDQLRGNKPGVQLVGEAAFTPPTPRQSTGLPSATPTHKENDDDSPIEKNGEVPTEVPLAELERPGTAASTISSEEGEYKSPRNESPNTLARLPPPPPPPPPSKMKEKKEKEKEPSPDHAAAFSNWIPKERKVQEVPQGMVEAMKKVEESMARGPPPKKEKRDEKAGGAKRGAGPPPHSSNSHHKNGEKKQKLDGAARKEEKGADMRTIPTIGSAPKGSHSTPVYKEKEKERKREERAREPSPGPFSAHEPAFPAAIAKKAVKVPYNGPSSLASSTPSSSSIATPPKKKKHLQITPEKKPQMSFLPVAGSSALPPHTSREVARPVPVDAILREAERLRQIEREREMRREREQQAAALHRVYDHVAASVAAAERRAARQPLINGGGGRMGDFDDELPWNQGRAPTYHPHRERPGTPVQDWYEAPTGQAPPPRAHSPSRFYDPMFDPRAPRDQFGRLEPDFGAMRPHHSSSLPPSHLHPLPHSLAPPPLHRAPSPAPPLQDTAWRREWHQQNWSDEPPRRGYWD